MIAAKGWRRFDSLTLRAVLVVVLAIGAVHLVSLWTYRHALHEQAELSNDARLADQLLTIKRAVMREPNARREAVAHELSGGPIEAHWSAAELARPGGPGAERWRGLAERLKASAPELAENGLIVGANRASQNDPHLGLVSMRLPDGSWVNVSLLQPARPASEGHGALMSTSLMALGALGVAIVLVRWQTRPLRAVASASQQFSGAGAPVALPEDGPREARELAAAFNDMQRRISRLVSDRTQALAAVSHDLRTPITRLRFRAEAIPDDALRAAIDADLSEMERMIGQTLAYLRGDPADEAVRPVDLVAILETICGDLVDAGARASVSGARPVILAGRRLALKRAFANLIDNAVKYGGRADVTVADGNEVTVTIADAGPGVAATDLERAFDPFVRLEPSRNRDTGGFGLGLSIARTIIEGHGGAVSLANAPGGGLVATARLPKAPQPN